MPREILYKYRSLDNFEFFVDILVNQSLYATSYKNMNDPMEGIYYASSLSRSIINDIRSRKESMNICSLSKERNHPLLWTHYANGSRGVNLGVEITGHNLIKREIIYGGTPLIDDCINTSHTALEILTHKLYYWDYEKEVRIFNSNNTQIKVLIKEIILGEKISSHHKKLIKKLANLLIPDAQIIDYNNI